MHAGVICEPESRLCLPGKCGMRGLRSEVSQEGLFGLAHGLPGIGLSVI